MNNMIALKMQDADNVATVFCTVAKDALLTVKDKQGGAETLAALTEIPYGHKIALRDIKAGEQIVKYGEVIGAATEDIGKGQYVHVHNLVSLRGRGDLA